MRRPALNGMLLCVETNGLSSPHSTSIRFSSSLTFAVSYTKTLRMALVSLMEHSKAMGLAKLLVKFSFLCLIARTCLAGHIIETSKSEDSSNLITAVVKIFKSCYETRVNAIGIAGNSPDSLIASLSSEEPFPVVLLDNTTRSVHNDPVSRISRHKLQIFAITAASPTKLRTTLMHIKSSKWWDHMASFYIIDSPTMENGCSRAFEFLWTAWRMNLLEAKFVCTHRAKGPSIYGFNPYTSDAPHPWKLVKIYNGENNHPWALLVRKSPNDRDLCKNIEFDKTNDLGGYEIRVSVKELPPPIRLNANKTGIDSLNGLTGRIWRKLFRSLNATVKLLIHRREDSLGSVDKEGNPEGLLSVTYNGISDIGLNERSLLSVSKLTWTYPHRHTGLSVITQYSGNESQLTKILSLIDISSRIGLCLVFIVTLIFLKYILDQTPMIAALNTLRLFCNSCLTRVPLYPASRIYLASLFLFMITIQGIYQGALSSLLAKRVPRLNIDTMQDLIESNHMIYSRKFYGVYFSDRAFEGRYIGTEDYNCTKYVLRDALAACVKAHRFQVLEAARDKLHLSRDLIISFPITFVIREDWPLEKRINVAIRKLVEANVFQYEFYKSYEKPLRIVRANDNEDRDLTFKILNLGDLSFAFAILGIGLALSTGSIQMVGPPSLNAQGSSAYQSES